MCFSKVITMFLRRALEHNVNSALYKYALLLLLFIFLISLSLCWLVH